MSSAKSPPAVPVNRLEPTVQSSCRMVLRGSSVTPCAAITSSSAGYFTVPCTTTNCQLAPGQSSSPAATLRLSWNFFIICGSLILLVIPLPHASQLPANVGGVERLPCSPLERLGWPPRDL